MYKHTHTEISQINSNLPCKSGYFCRKLNIWTPNTPLLNARIAQTRYDEIWKFAPIIFFITLCIFYIKIATSEGGDCVSLIGKHPSIYMNLNVYLSICIFINVAINLHKYKFIYINIICNTANINLSIST